MRSFGVVWPGLQMKPFESLIERSVLRVTFAVVIIGAFGSVAVSGDGERIADHPWDVKFILPNNENIFRSIIRLNNHLNKNNIRKRLNYPPPASMRFSRLERI